MLGVQCFPIVLAVMLLALPFRSSATGEQQFDTPEAAVAALTQAASTKDTNAVRTIFGPEGHELMSPDIVQASEGFDRFTKYIAEKVELSPQSESTIVLNLGNEGWPFPIPLVKQDGKWFFDVAAGKPAAHAVLIVPASHAVHINRYL